MDNTRIASYLAISLLSPALMGVIGLSSFASTPQKDVSQIPGVNPGLRVIPSHRQPGGYFPLYCIKKFTPTLEFVFNYPTSKFLNLREIAVQYAANGQYKQALEIVFTLPEKNSQAVVLAEIASYVPQNSQKQTLELLQNMLPHLQENYPRNTVLKAIAIEYAASGEFKSALKIAQAIKDRYFKDKAITGIAIKYADMGNVDQAIRVIKTFNKVDSQNYQLMEITEQLAKQGKYNLAFQFVSTLKEECMQINALEEIWESSLERGKSDQVMKPILAINNDRIKNELVIRIIQNNIYDYFQRSITQQLLRLKLGLEIAQTIKEDDIKNNTLIKIAKEYVNIGRLDEALNLSQLTSDSNTKDKLLTELLEYYLTDKQLETALSLANKIQKPLVKVRYLTKIASNYHQAGQTEKASQLLSEALEINKLIEEYKTPRIFFFPTPVREQYKAPPVFLPSIPDYAPDKFPQRLSPYS